MPVSQCPTSSTLSRYVSFPAPLSPSSLITLTTRWNSQLSFNTTLRSSPPLCPSSKSLQDNTLSPTDPHEGSNFPQFKTASARIPPSTRTHLPKHTFHPHHTHPTLYPPSKNAFRHENSSPCTAKALHPPAALEAQAPRLCKTTNTTPTADARENASPSAARAQTRSAVRVSSIALSSARKRALPIVAAKVSLLRDTWNQMSEDRRGTKGWVSARIEILPVEHMALLAFLRPDSSIWFSCTSSAS